MLIFGKNKLEHHLYHPFWQSFYMIALVLSMTIILGSALLFGWQRYFINEYLESILPAEDTVLIAKLDLNPFKTQTHSFREVLKDHPSISFPTFFAELKLLEEDKAYNLNLEIKPWLANKSAFVILKKEADFLPIWFLQYSDLRTLEAFTKDRLNTIDQEEQASILLGSQKFYFEILDNYIAFSTSPLPFQMLEQSKTKTLAQDSSWQELQKKLPAGKSLSLFFRPQAYYDFLLRKEPEQKVDSFVSNYLKTFSAAMTTLTLADSSAEFSVAITTNQYLSAVTKTYNPSLLSYLKQDDRYFLSGTDLHYKLSNTTSNLSAGKIALGMPWKVYEVEWQNKSGLDFQKDILTFLQDEYLYAGGSDHKSQRLILKIPQNRQDQLIEKLKQALEAYLPRLNAKKISRTLPDGKTYQELVTGENSILNLVEEEEAGVQFSSYQSPQLDFGIYYLKQGDTLIIAPYKEGILKSLEDGSLDLNEAISSLNTLPAEMTMLKLASLSELKITDNIPLSAIIEDFLASLAAVYNNLLINQSLESNLIKLEFLLFDKKDV